MIGSLSEYNSCTEDLETDVLISGDVVSFIAEYKAGVREFGSLKINPLLRFLSTAFRLRQRYPAKFPMYRSGLLWWTVLRGEI